MAHSKAIKADKNLKAEVKTNGFDDKKISKGRGRKRLATDEVIQSPKKLKVDLQHPQVEDGVVLTVGTGDIGQLGLGPDVEEKTRPCVVPNLKDIVQVCAGGLHSLCITKDGKVYSWGCNDEGGLGRQTASEEDNFCIGEVKLPGKAVQISAGDCHSAALLSDGRVFAWGSFRDNSGPLGFVEQGTIQNTPRQLLHDIPITKIASGNSHLVFLAYNGQVFTCGCGESGQLGRLAEVFATRHSRNGRGTDHLLVPSPIKVYKARKSVYFSDIWAGGYVTFVKAKDSNDIYGFGLNNFGQLGDEDTNMKFQPYLLKGFKGMNCKQIAAAQHHSLALDSNGVVYAMGRNEYGRLGLGEGVDAYVPTPLPSFSEHKAKYISAGECVSFIVLENGEGYGFGMGSNNQLGQGDDEDRWEPTTIKGKQIQDKKIICVEAGGQHSIILATTQ